MEYLKIDSYEFKLYETPINFKDPLEEKMKKILDFCALKTEIKNLDQKIDIVVFLEIFPHPINKIKYHLDFISSVDINIMKIKMIGLGYNNYIGILRNNNPEMIINHIINYVKNNQKWRINNKYLK